MAYRLMVYQNNVEDGKKMMDKYLASNPQGEHSELLNRAYLVELKLAKGNPAPEFKFPDVDGKMVFLEDFKGKLVYLDIWASWCGPCLQEIPAAKKLEEEMRGKDVVFLGISMDKDETAWKDILKAKEISGYQLISTGNFDSEIAKLYNVKGIPRYILIDKEGKIINSNAKRPSMDAKAEIEMWLNH